MRLLSGRVIDLQASGRSHSLPHSLPHPLTPRPRPLGTPQVLSSPAVDPATLAPKGTILNAEKAQDARGKVRFLGGVYGQG